MWTCDRSNATCVLLPPLLLLLLLRVLLLTHHWFNADYQPKICQKLLLNETKNTQVSTRSASSWSYLFISKIQMNTHIHSRPMLFTSHFNLTLNYTAFIYLASKKTRLIETSRKKSSKHNLIYTLQRDRKSVRKTSNPAKIQPKSIMVSARKHSKVLLKHIHTPSLNEPKCSSHIRFYTVSLYLYLSI